MFKWILWYIWIVLESSNVMWLNGVLMCYMKYGVMWKCDQDIIFSRKEILCRDCYFGILICECPVNEVI